jgi:hypothetical protein
MTPGDHLFRTILDSTVRMLAKEIKAKDAQLLEQDKLIANLTEENERLKPMRRKVKFVEKVRTGKASSWRRSAWLGLRDGILMAPDRLFQSLKLPAHSPFSATSAPGSSRAR